MIDMTNRADIQVRFLPLKLLFTHLILLIEMPLTSSRSKQLQAQKLVRKQSPGAGLNRRPRPYQGRALPTELPGQTSRRIAPDSIFNFMLPAIHVLISPPYTQYGAGNGTRTRDPKLG